MLETQRLAGTMLTERSFVPSRGEAPVFLDRRAYC